MRYLVTQPNKALRPNGGDRISAAGVGALLELSRSSLSAGLHRWDVRGNRSDCHKVLKYGLCILWTCTALTATIFWCLREQSYTTTDQALKSNIRDCCSPFFTHVQCDPCTSHPVYAISFDSLRIENSTIGFFRTATHQTAKVYRLKLKLWEQDEGYSLGDNACVDGTGLKIERLCYIMSNLVTLLGSQSTQPVDDTVQISLEGLDIMNTGTNVSGVHVEDFRCEFLRGCDTLLAINSQTATVSYQSRDVMLRGHVVISTGPGQTLEANHVEWDLSEGVFRVRGHFALRNDSREVRGDGAEYDYALRRVRMGSIAGMKR